MCWKSLELINVSWQSRQLAIVPNLILIIHNTNSAHNNWRSRFIHSLEDTQQGISTKLNIFIYLERNQNQNLDFRRQRETSFHP